jgi:dTDP-4-dehydrorhamnose reductase
VFDDKRQILWNGECFMKLALVGSGGYIAGFLLESFEHAPYIESVLKIGQNENADEYLDLQKPEDFKYNTLDEIDIIIFTAAISGPDKCAMDFEFCWNINVTGTQYFIKRAVAKHCKVLFFSSDAVFGDFPGQIYDEESLTQANTPYGQMKKTIEDEFENSPYFKIIRLPYVTSTKDKFISYCLECLSKNEVAEIFHPFYRNCIVVSEVVDVVHWMALHWGEYTPSVLNVAGKELVSRVRIADELNRHLRKKLKYTIVQPDVDFYKNRPQITQMKSLYLSQYHILEDSTFTEKIKKELEEIEL